MSTKVAKSVPMTRITTMMYIDTMMNTFKGVRPSASLALVWRIFYIKNEKAWMNK